MKSAQQGTFLCQNAVFLVNRLALHQGRGLAAFQTGRDICSQKRSLSIYPWQDRNDSTYLCALQVQRLLAGVRKHYLPSQSAHRSSAQSYPQSFRRSLWMFFIFLLLYPTHLFEWFWVLHSLCVHVCLWMCVDHLCCKTPAEELYLSYDFVKHWTHWELSGVLLLLWCNKPLF